MEFLDLTDPFTGRSKQSTIVYSQGDFIAYDIHKWCKLPLLLKFELSKINGVVVLSNLYAKLFYNYAEIKKGKVQRLLLLEYQKLRKNRGVLKNDKAAQKEFEELEFFAERFLLKGNLSRFLIEE
jgi:hypothetical protein